MIYIVIFISYVIVFYFIGLKIGNLTRELDDLSARVDYLEKENEDEDEEMLLAYVRYLNGAKKFIPYDEWSKMYNCGGYHD